jgi:hypothetical protein
MSKGSLDKAHSTLNPGSMIFQADESPMEMTEIREVQHPEPQVVNRQAVRGQTAFRTFARPAVQRSLPPVEILERGRPEDPILGNAVVSVKVRQKAQAKHQADKGIERLGRSGTLREDPEPNLDIRPTAVGQPRQEASAKNGKVVPKKGPSMELREIRPTSPSVELPEEHITGRSARKGIDVEAATDTRDAGIPGRATGIQPNVHQTSASGPLRMTSPEGIRSSKFISAENPGKAVREPLVQVTIGRIEVRAVPAQEAKERRGKMPELDLADYLRKPAVKVAK